MHKNCN